MCNFLSLVETERHHLFFFLPHQRIAHAKNPLTDKHGNAYKMDSHASICAFYGLDEDAVNKYEWNPYTRKLSIDNKVFDVDKDRVQKGLDEIDWRPICGDIEGLRVFCDRMKEIPFFKNNGILPDGVKLFKHRVSAEAAIWYAACDAAKDAAYGAAKDAAYGAAKDAACDAAKNAARDAAKNAARDAAKAFAWYAACDAAKDAARDAAKDFAWDAACDAGWDAAWAAVITYVCDGLPIEARHVEYIKKRWSIWEAGYGVLCDVDGVLYCYEKP